jgi:hypothetical protein
MANAHKIEISIKNWSTGEEIAATTGDLEYALVDELRPVFENLLRQYRERYPVGLRSTKIIN